MGVFETGMVEIRSNFFKKHIEAYVNVKKIIYFDYLGLLKLQIMSEFLKNASTFLKNVILFEFHKLLASVVRLHFLAFLFLN